jgi:hypothetical protein
MKTEPTVDKMERRTKANQHAVRCHRGEAKSHKYMRVTDRQTSFVPNFKTVCRKIHAFLRLALLREETDDKRN